MSASGFMWGSLFGLGVNLYSLGVRKLPLMSVEAMPRHGLALAIGGGLGYGLQSWQNNQARRLVAELNQLGKNSAGAQRAL